MVLLKYMKDKDSMLINSEVGLPSSDVHNNYPEIDKRFLMNPGCIGSYKIEWDNYVYTLNKKIVAILSHNEKYNSDILNLKLRVEDNMQLQDMYPNAIVPGYHMNKIHWSSIILKELDTLPPNLIYELIDESYFLIFTGLPKKTQELISPSRRKEYGKR